MKSKSQEEKELDINFRTNCYLLNFNRIRLFSFIFLICNAIILTINFINHSKGIGNKNPFSQYYIPAYIFFLTYFFIMCLFAFFRRPTDINEIKWRHRIQIHVFAIMMIVWISVITFIDLRVNGGITVFALGLLGLSTILFLHFSWSLILHISAGIIFYWLLKTSDPNEDKMIADLLNGSIMIIVSFIISQIINVEKKRQFIKDTQIQKQKEELENTNANLNAENLKNEMLQLIIKNYIPQTTWKKADLNSSLSLPKIPEEEIEITCLFLDIVSFTTFAEERSPKEVIEKLNRVYAPIVKTIYNNEGDIDKFIGDAIFAVFDKCPLAIKSAFEIIENISKAEKDSKVDIRIGIHSGKVIRGDVGGEFRRDNTLIGDTVNIASRLQTSCEPNELIVSEHAALNSGGIFHFKEITTISLKGKIRPISVFRIKFKN